MRLIKSQFLKIQSVYSKFNIVKRCVTTGCTNITARDLDSTMKHEIENHWKDKLGSNKYDLNSNKPKQYVLAMFPYPSGYLHMGHVRVYAISDAMARFYRLNGMNVLHPMGWDAFGLPAENAAIERQIPADVWTKQNISHMKNQLDQLQLSFDWSREMATCDPKYYKWTQKLFLMLFNDGLAYQKEAMVNWDPVDKTVLADEQVDANGCSWRSGAHVEKKLFKQWFVRTTKFAKSLRDGLEDPTLEDWKDIIKLQKHWIGDCDGYNFELQVENRKDKITVWTKNPEELKYASYIAVHKDHLLNTKKIEEGKLGIEVRNPFNGDKIPIIISNDVDFPLNCDTFVGIPSNLEIFNPGKDKEEVLKQAKELNIGGYPVSSKLKDWLISRQRFWGTPIPIVHCKACGTVPVPDDQLPITLPNSNIGSPLSQNETWIATSCPKCGSADAKRETDTMDTFVDSSWYFLRFIDAKNDEKMFDKELAAKTMPVDLYVGGKEHAVLHLYYARFMNHFLYSKGLVPQPEPFKRLLVQGMVMGRSFRLKGSGKYLNESEVEIVDAKKNKAIEKASGAPVVAMWEKMSKSKLNGVDPIDVLKEHGSDTLRLIMLADMAPTSNRNWSSATFPGILNWQRRIWMTMHDYEQIRSGIKTTDQAPNSKEFEELDFKLFDSRNYFIAGTTFNYKYSHQLSVAISKMQGLTNAIRRAPPEIVAYSKQYERAIASMIIMIAPIAPHFAAELWSRFVALPHRLNAESEEIKWNSDVLQQNWPLVDEEYELDLSFRVNGAECFILKFPKPKLNQLTHQDSLDLAFNQDAVIERIGGRKIRITHFVLYPNCHAILGIDLQRGKIENPEKEAAEQ